MDNRLTQSDKLDEQSVIKPGRTVRVVGDYLEICSDYDEALVHAIRAIPGRSWDKVAAKWFCPLFSYREAIERLKPFGFLIDAEVASLGEIAARQRDQEEEKKRRKDEGLRQAQLALESTPGEIAFVTAGNVKLTKRLKKHGVFSEVHRDSGYGSTVVGYMVPEAVLIQVLGQLGLPADIDSRLVSVLREAFTVNVEAKQFRSWHTTAGRRYGKKEHLLGEACRLAAVQSTFVWGWKQDPHPPANEAAWVLYFEKDGQQLSFHSFERGDGPDFLGEWNGRKNISFPW